MCNDLATLLLPPPSPTLSTKTAWGIISPPNKQQCLKQPLPFQSKGIYFLIRNYTSSLSIFIDAKPGELCCREHEGDTGREIVQWMLLQRALIEIFLGRIKAAFTVWPSKLQDKDFLYCLRGRIRKKQTSNWGWSFECPRTTKLPGYD